ncbi:MAG: DNA topoisomerase IV subunit A [Spirochaetes bacterium]|nr:DNA topoisomerase IV subunit A [Spirochaetota bacterium]
MAYIKNIFKDNFLHFASYVIKDRAIPDVEDGLKPVQRRILHTLFEVDDGKFHKVANIVGHCMKYHPHGDQSIYSALVVLANKELFIEKQGNFGNIFTGDEASAARYIECRITPFAKEILYNPKITEYAESYDGRNKEPVIFPAKLPLVLIPGVEGIAVGMSTKILPHNPVEIIEAEIACLQDKDFVLYPDFITGGIADVSDYQDGQGKVRTRAALDTSDPKRIVIRELPYGVTTESLIESIEKAAKSGRLKIASITDYTTEHVEIEIKLARGEYSADTIDALYAFTKCEQSISCNLLVIKDGVPTLMTVRDIIRLHAKQLLKVLKAELDIHVRELLDELHARTLERIFIEERVYKQIENKKTQESVRKAVIDGLLPFAAEIKREVTLDDVERLLKIPIRRISLYDIEKARSEMALIKQKLKDARYHLAHLTEYGISFLSRVAEGLRPLWKRKATITSFDKVDAKEAARRDIALRYDRQSGYLGTAVSGGEYLFPVSPFDKLLVIRSNGLYAVSPVPEKLFVDKDMPYCTIADKDALASVIFSAVYRDPKTAQPYIKRIKIEGWIMNKDYHLVPEHAELLFFTAEPDKKFTVHYAGRSRLKAGSQVFNVKNFEVKGLKANGIKVLPREVVMVQGVDSGLLFQAEDLPSGTEGKATTAADKAKSLSAAAAAKKSAGSKAAAAKHPAAAGSKTSKASSAKAGKTGTAAPARKSDTAKTSGSASAKQKPAGKAVKAAKVSASSKSPKTSTPNESKKPGLLEIAGRKKK